MKNNANTHIPLSPEESYLASKLFGKSLFSAIQLSKEMELAEKMRHPSDGGETLRIPIPMDRMGKLSEENAPSPGIIGRALRFNRNPIRTFVGGEAGFHEGRREYFDSMKAQIQRDLDHAQREYLGTLQQIKQGEEETPLVDMFCNGLAAEATMGDMLPKVAGNTAEDVNISDGSIKRLIGEGFGFARKPIQPVLDMGATGLLGTAAGSSYLTYILKKKLREKEQDNYTNTELPTRIELEPYR